MLGTLLQQMNQLLTLWIIFPTVLILGLYLTYKLRGVQFTHLKLGLKHLTQKDPSSEGNISNFEAISAVLAGNLGTGNISGIAIALSLGGPGAMVWMWVMAFFGAVLKYSGCFLGLKYRQKNAQGEYVGGPMYYLSKGLGYKKMAVFFALAAICTSFTVGNLVQVNSIFLPLQKTGWNQFPFVLALVAFTTFLLAGGLNRIAKWLGALVPTMTVLYLGTALFILGLNASKVLPSLSLMLSSALQSKALIGGGLGYGVFQAIKSGFERGIFATDAGCGIAPILQSSAKCNKPHLEGLVSMVAPFVVMIICTVTGLVLIATGASESGEQSTNMCTWAFQSGLGGHFFGKAIVLVSLVLFALTTIITWAYCGEKAVEFLGSSRWIRIYKIAFIALLPLGAYCRLSLAWTLADISIALMLITNLIGVWRLSKIVIEETHTELALVKKNKRTHSN